MTKHVQVLIFRDEETSVIKGVYDTYEKAEVEQTNLINGKLGTRYGGIYDEWTLHIEEWRVE